MGRGEAQREMEGRLLAWTASAADQLDCSVWARGAGLGLTAVSGDVGG